MPNWRQIEAACIKVLRDYGYSLTQERGETYVTLNEEEVCVSEFAKHLAEELAA